ncbi:MAG TPA: M13 family metallopeptidase [Bryobacteraceae bacterium]
MELRIARFTFIAVPMLALGMTAWVWLQPNVHAQTGDGIDLKGMDTTVAPGDDFNAYANGGWMKATPIPADKPTYGIFVMLADDTRKRTVDLIQEAAKGGSSTGGDGRKVGDFYATFMDAATVESKGLAPLKPQLDAIAAVANRRDLARILGGQLRADVDPLNNTKFGTGNLFGVWITQGLTDPSRSYPYLLQGGLGMPDRDYYLSASPSMAEERKQYQSHIAAMFKLTGFAEPAARAARVFALETKMAQVHATRVESEDVHSAVVWPRQDLIAKAPGIEWPALLEAAGLNDAAEFIIWHPRAIPGLAALVAKEPLEAWKDWLVFHSLEKAAGFLPDAFVQESFAFHGKVLSGTPELQPRWQRGVDYTSAALGEAVGRLYVQRYFPAETKARVQAMVNDLVKAFGKRIDALTWMSPETKRRAKEKLATLKVGVAYPDRWRDYSGLQIVKGDALGNAQRAELFEYRRQLAKLKQPVDRAEWWMTPQTVNAVNLPLQNALNFPAAILQPPFFDPQADAAHNYGAIGTVIGHEISHSFDDQGSQFDASGRLVNWWTMEDLKHFQAAGEALAAEFDAYHPFLDLTVNGHQTLSENIADLAGILTAYDAYRLSLKGKPDVTKNGFSGDQRFFISFAQNWRNKMRDAALRMRIATDGHAPPEYRADTVRNVDAWYDAFPAQLSQKAQPSQKLYLAPKDRVRIW